MSYKLGGVIWNDDGTMATEKLTPLEALQDLRDVQGWNEIEYTKRLDVIEKSLKTLEIIKKKQVDVYRFMTCETLATYNLHYAILRKNELRKYEYELLKEILC